MTEDTRPQTRSRLERLLGDRPLALAVRLALISLLVGFVMTVFGFDAGDLVRGAMTALRDLMHDGAGLFRQMGAYIVTGAAVVVPVWLLLRLTRRG